MPPVEKQYVLQTERVSVADISSTQSPCAVLYCHLWPLRLYTIFPHYLINDKIFKKKIIEPKMRVLTSSKTFL